MKLSERNVRDVRKGFGKLKSFFAELSQDLFVVLHWLRRLRGSGENLCGCDVQGPARARVLAFAVPELPGPDGPFDSDSRFLGQSVPHVDGELTPDGTRNEGVELLVPGDSGFEHEAELRAIAALTLLLEDRVTDDDPSELC